MDGWKQKPLGALIKEIGDGGTPDTNKKEYFGGKIPWIVIQDIKKEIWGSKTHLTELGLASCSAKLWPVSAVILSTGATIGEVGLAKVPLATKQGIHGIVCGSELESGYLYYILQTLRDFLRANAQGSTIREIRAPFLKTIPILFPESRLEQAKIIEVLSIVDRAIEQTEALIAKQQRIKTGLMQDLLTKGIDEHGNLRSEKTHKFKDSPLGRIPVEWDVVPLSFFVKRLDAGVSVNSEDRPCGSGQVGVLKTSALNNGKFSPNENKAVIREEESRVKVSPMKNTILISRMNTPELVGESGFVDKDYSNLYLPDRIWMTIFNTGKELSARWLAFIMISPYVRNFISLNATGTSGSMKNLSKRALFNMPICAPNSSDEQQHISNILSVHVNLLDQLYDSRSKLYFTKTALMQDLLTGKKRVTALLNEKEVASV